MQQSRITDVTLWPFTMQQKQTIRISLGTLSAENVLVRLRTNDGVVGWGESSPYPAVMGETQSSDLATGKQIGEIIKGKNPFMVSKIVQDIDGFMPGHPGIRAAFEMAVWDIIGKHAGQPVCSLLGACRDSFLTDLTVYLDTPQVMASKAKHIADQGMKVVKVKLGEAPEMDVERLRAVREAVGPYINLRIDANQGWDPATAVRALKELEKFRVEFCEQPVPYWDWDGMKFVRERSPIPIMADESVDSPHDAIQAIRRDACDMINVKLMKSGGILNAMRISQIAAAAGMKCMFGCMGETRVAITAAAHVVCANPNVQFADLDSFTEHHIDPVISGVQLKDGALSLPTGPGLGLDIDPGWLKNLQSA